ncbi:hypothetical protein ABZ297_31415 [Nonomuraea sp. NPDC005983]
MFLRLALALFIIVAGHAGPPTDGDSYRIRPAVAQRPTPLP